MADESGDVGVVRAGMDSTQLTERVKALGPWFHQIEVAPGIRTRDIAPSVGPQPVDHPRSRWEVVGPHLPADLQGARVLDIGCADGFFTLELARRGATVVAQDAARGMINRLEWAARVQGLWSRITTRVG